MNRSTQQFKNHPTFNSRRVALGYSLAGIAATALAACGGGGSDKEGVDIFTWDVKLLNLASTETNLSVTLDGVSAFSAAPYGQVSTKTIKDENFRYPAAELVFKGASGFSGTLKSVNVGPALYLILSNGDSSGNTTGFVLRTVGGIPGAYDPLNLGHVLPSYISKVTGGAPVMEVFTRESSTATLAKQGASLTDSGNNISVSAAASSSFQMVLKDAATGATVFDSGLRAKQANIVFFIARTATKSTTWSVFAIDSVTNTAAIWPSI